MKAAYKIKRNILATILLQSGSKRRGSNFLRNFNPTNVKEDVEQ